MIIIMPLFLRTREPLRQERLILGGAVTSQLRHHRIHKYRYPMKMSHHKKLAVKPAAAATAAAAARVPKQARRRGVSTQRKRYRRPPARKQHQAPLSQQRRLQQRSNQTRKKRPAKQTSRKVSVKKGKAPRTIANSVKQALGQLTNSRQIQRAVKGVIADVNLPQTGKQLLNHAKSAAAAAMLHLR